MVHASGDKIELVTNDERLAYDNKMTQSGQCEYRKTVFLSGVEVFEEKKK